MKLQQPSKNMCSLYILWNFKNGTIFFVSDEKLKYPYYYASDFSYIVLLYYLILLEEETTRHRKHVDASINVPLSIVHNDTREQFQLFRLLEKFLTVPLSFKMQMLCPLNQSTEQMLIEKWAGFLFVYFSCLNFNESNALDDDKDCR